MTRLRILMLAVAAVLVATALGGASSASATVLCKHNEAPCSGGNTVPLPATLNPKAPKLSLQNSMVNLECGSSAMTLKVEENLGVNKGLAGQVTNLSIGSCNWIGCKTQEFVNLPYHAKITGTGNGTLTLSDGGKGDPKIRMTGCGSPPGGSECEYSAASVEMGFNLTQFPAVITSSNAPLPLTKGGFGCYQKKWEMSAEYEDFGAQSFDGHTAKSVIEDTSNKPLMTCEANIQGSLGGTSSKLGSLGGTISEFTLSACSSGICPTVAASGLPWETGYTRTSAGNGLLGIGNLQFALKNCSFLKLPCTYAATKAPIELDVVGESEMVANKEPLSRISGTTFCPASALWSANIAVSGDSYLTLVSEP